MDKTVYICTGSCSAEVSQEEFEGGLTVCGTDRCTLKGQPFEMRLKCEHCGALHTETPETGHSHDHNH